jgi:N-acetylmuramoyl-L-alanine amidase
VLDIGHQKEKPGAMGIQSNGNAITEFEFNEEIAHKIKDRLCLDTVIMYRKSYSTLPYDINAHNPDFTVSLHCNAFNTQVSGTEVLYWHTSQEGKVLAACMQNSFLKLGFKDRGIKALQASDRGSSLLQKTLAPCVICEPFFIDNYNDLYYVLMNKDLLVDLYIEGIYAYTNQN